MKYFDYLYKKNNIKLNSQQINAVNHNEGHALVLSTAGSGKTTVITARTGRLIFDNKCESKKILTITFSKMAALEMQKRFQMWFGEQNKKYTDFSTIHAFAYRIVRDYYNKQGKSFNILNNNYSILTDILKEEYKNKYYSNINTEEIENLSNKIGYITNMMLNPSNYRDYGIKIKNFSNIYDKYQEYKVQNNLIDFDDMLVFCVKILKNIKRYNNYIKHTYQYIQVDEVQDTSKIQHEIIKIISNGNLFMVGDDDQSIYSFRGSYPEFLLNFKDVYKDSTIYYLDNNYRSDKHIVNTAREFIEINDCRYEKNIYTQNKAQNEVNIAKFDTRAKQSKFVLKKILESKDESVAVLYRNNISSIIIANELSSNNIDFYIKEDKNKFFNNFVVLDIIAFMKLSLNPYDKKSFSRIYYKSYTYFSKVMCNFVLNDSYSKLTVFNKLEKYRNLNKNNIKNIKRFKKDLETVSKQTPEEAVEYIKNEMEYIEYLDRLDEEGRVNYSNAFLMLEILKEIATHCLTITDFLDEIDKLNVKIKESASKNKGSRITLSTIHSVKGLEFDTVFMIDNIDGEFPPDRKRETSEEYEEILEEERRVFYVGMTRAKEQLYILSPQKTSLFVNEIIYGGDEKYEQKLKIGTNVKHVKFGNGKIKNIDRNTITIKFKKRNTVKLDINIVVERKILEII